MKTARGFTLIEMMTAVAIMAIVVAGISQVLITQSQASNSQSLQRDLEENGRIALLELSRAVRLAGYGITPVAAFDFGRFACSTPGSIKTCNGGSNWRDRMDGPDELVVAWRDPNFSRPITSISGTAPYTVAFTGALTKAIAANSIVQVVGAGGSADYLAVSTAAAVGATSVSLRLLTNADGYFTPSVAPTVGSGAYLTLVTRSRYYVANDPSDGVPALYRDRGDGNPVLFRGIEDVQYEYDIGQPPSGSANASVTPPVACNGVNSWAFGICPTQTTPVEPDPTATAPDWQNDLYDSSNRYTANPANIRRVTISIVARSTRQSPDKAGDSVPVVGNRPARAADLYKRTILQMTEQPVNLLSRQTFQPIILAGTDPSVGGG